MSSDEPPLPDGWIKEYDSNHNRHFYVDSKANPPRSIWVHPYEDELYLKENPKVREKLGIYKSSGDFSSTRTRGESSTARPRAQDQTLAASASTTDVHKRGFFGKLKDKAIGSKEERNLRAAQQAQLQEQRRAQRLSMPTQRSAQYPSYQQQYPQQANYYQGGYNAPPVNAGRRGGGFGGIGLPILGGLAGGLILGEALDGFGGDGGGFGGGDFGGGDFGGGGGDFGGGF